MGMYLEEVVGFYEEAVGFKLLRLGRGEEGEG